MDPTVPDLPESATPEPDQPPKQRPKPVAAREMSADQDFGADISPTSIAKMLRAVHPFYSYYEYVACRRYPRRGSAASRVEQMITAHPRFFWTMLVCDVVFILVPLSVALVAAVAIIGYKTLWL